MDTEKEMVEEAAQGDQPELVIFYKLLKRRNNVCVAVTFDYRRDKSSTVVTHRAINNSVK